LRNLPLKNLAAGNLSSLVSPTVSRGAQVKFLCADQTVERQSTPAFRFGCGGQINHVSNGAL